MKKTTLIFLSTLIAVFLSASESYAAIYSSVAECKRMCSTKKCSSSGICFAPGEAYCKSAGVFAAGPYWTLSDCQYAQKGYVSYLVRSCYQDGSYYRFEYKNTTCKPSCPTNCSSCSSSSVCTTCNSGYYLSSGSCKSCPANATCDGSSSFTCKSGYKKSGSSCIKDRTVNSCPSRMKLSSDGCCCINK